MKESYHIKRTVILLFLSVAAGSYTILNAESKSLFGSLAIDDAISQAADPEWITDTMAFDDMDLAYHLFVPESYNDTVNYPLVVHLHGGDQTIQDKLVNMLTHRGPADFVSEPVQSKYPCIVLAPISERASQVWFDPDPPEYWGDYFPFSYNRSFHPLIGLIDSLSRDYNIDTDRIYLNGISAGGLGAWIYLRDYPDYFAAALILCGVAWTNNESQMESISHIPVWNHHGDRDYVHPVTYSRRIFQGYEARGIPVFYPDRQKYVKPKITDSLKKNIIEHDIDYIYSEHKGGGHNVGDVCFNDTMVYEWLFSKRKRTAGIISFRSDTSLPDLQPEHLFRFDCSVDSLQIAMQYSADLGYNWIEVAQLASSADSVVIDTRQLDDSPKGQFRIQLVNNEGYVIGSDYSGYFKVDNPENFAPWLKHYLSAVKYDGMEVAVRTEQLKVMLYANDVENDTLDLEYYIRVDENAAYELIGSRRIAAMDCDQPLTIPVDTFGVGNTTRIRFILSDGEKTVSDSTVVFGSLDYEKTDLWVWPSSVNLDIGDSIYLNYNLYPIFEADRQVSLYSKHPEIAAIADQVVRAVSPGETYICLVAEADDGHFADSCRVTVNTPVSIPVAHSDQVRMYPNPVNDILRIYTGSGTPVMIDVISINGQLLYTNTLHGSSHTLDLSSYPKGIYFITIRSEDFVRTEKIIKM